MTKIFNDAYEPLSPLLADCIELGRDEHTCLSPVEESVQNDFLDEYSVLFVDDERNLLNSLFVEFRRRYSVHMANNAEEAKRVLDVHGDMDVIVSDLRMPGKNGLDLLAWVKKNHPDTNRILLTGFADVETAVRSVNSINVFRLLTKPCSMDVLKEAVLAGCIDRKVKALRDQLDGEEKCGSILEGVIRSFNHISEQRDPYTARHQRRVSGLARMIANEMMLDEEHTKALELAGLIHDVGKVFVPLAYLNKSGRLGNLEYSVIRQHPEWGYELLSHIDRMQHVAKIILQHHERIDGSGYPYGLVGEQISIEARILAVADTAEAMNSHRPYRQSLGLDSALGELMQHRGRLYDKRVVDAACRVLVNDAVWMDLD